MLNQDQETKDKKERLHQAIRQCQQAASAPGVSDEEAAEADIVRLNAELMLIVLYKEPMPDPGTDWSPDQQEQAIVQRNEQLANLRQKFPEVARLVANRLGS